MYSFDIPVERRNTDSIKWDRYKGRNVIPMWLADMDFMSPPPVIEALEARVRHGIFGYTSAPEELYETAIAHLKREYDWTVEPEWLVWLPGVVTGLTAVCSAMTEKGQGVISCYPVYYPFLETPRLAERRLLKSALVKDKGRYVMDYDAIEELCDKDTRLFELCNPHNPVGTVFTRAELERLAEICLRHDLIIGSDEIHCGLVLDEGKRHIPIASLSDEVAQRTVTMMAPSKTYNIPGLGCAFAVVPNQELRMVLLRSMKGMVPFVNTLGYTAAIAAYRDCDVWHEALIKYLRENRDILEEAVARIPGIGMAHVEATYLGWLDIGSLGLERPTLFFENFGVGLNDGAHFGQPGFVRINFACPRAQLRDALSLIEAGVRSLQSGALQ